MKNVNDMKLSPIGKETVVERIVNEIVNCIISGYYKIGSKLPNEFEMMEKLCVSRASLREAMKVLSTLGIIEIRRGDGTYVSSKVNTSLFDKVIYSMISEESTTDELLELRQILDETTLYFAMEKITDEKLENLENNIKEMEKAMQNLDVEEVKIKDYEFHIMLIKSCENVFFEHIMNGIYSIFEKSIHDTVNMEKIDTKAAFYHRQMVQCLKNKEREKVHEIIKNSLITWKDNI